MCRGRYGTRERAYYIDLGGGKLIGIDDVDVVANHVDKMSSIGGPSRFRGFAAHHLPYPSRLQVGEPKPRTDPKIAVRHPFSIRMPSDQAVRNRVSKRPVFDQFAAGAFYDDQPLKIADICHLVAIRRHGRIKRFLRTKKQVRLGVLVAGRDRHNRHRAAHMEVQGLAIRRPLRITSDADLPLLGAIRPH